MHDTPTHHPGRTIVALILFTIVFATIPNTAQGQSDKRGVIVFSEENYRGRSEVFTGEALRLVDNSLGNANINSVRVRPGCRVAFRGARAHSLRSSCAAILGWRSRVKTPFQFWTTRYRPSSVTSGENPHFG